MACNPMICSTWKSSLSYGITGIGNITIATIGIVLNIFGLFVFRRIQNKHLFHQMIIALTAFDICVLVFSIAGGVYRGFKVRNLYLAYTYPYITHPFLYISVCASIYMTLCISYERYTALQDPVRYSNGMQRLRRNKFLAYFFSVTGFAITYNITRFLEFSIVCPPDFIHKHKILNRNITVAEPKELPSKVPICNLTNDSTITVVRQPNLFDNEGLFRNMDYHVPSGIFRMATSLADCIVMGVIPISLLIYFNFRTYIFIRKQRKYIQENFTVHQSRPEDCSQRIRRQEIRMAITFAVVGIMFVISYVSWLTYATINAYHATMFKKCQVMMDPTQIPAICDITKQYWYILLQYLGPLMLTFNSSINVLIYGSTWNQFRERAKELIKDIRTSVTSLTSYSTAKELVDDGSSIPMRNLD